MLKLSCIAPLEGLTERGEAPSLRQMDISVATLVLLPIGLGLLGFVEPCTIGAHLVFLDTQKNRDTRQKTRAVLVFILVRALVAGLVGVLISLLGGILISLQTGLWLVFGVVYLALGAAFLLGRAGRFKRRLALAPSAWKNARNPVVLGLAFGLNIPACAAPILFALLGMAATSGTVASGFVMMFLFGFFLSAPLALFAFIPALAGRMDRLAVRLVSARLLIGCVFVILGLWSIWFGLFVNPVNWSGQ